MRFPSTLLLAGLMLLVASPLAAAAPREMRVTFETAGRMKLSGTLTLPSEAAAPDKDGTHVPAVLLIQGSGPVDRNGSAPPHLNWATLELVAAHLADAGIASLRYDKRGMHANSAELPGDSEQLKRFFRWEAFVDDAEAALRFLRAYPQIDGRRLAVVGHSEGGLIALELANRSIPDLRTIVLLATPGRPIGAVLHDQLLRTLTLQNATEQQKATILAANARILTEIERTEDVPRDVPPELSALYPAYLGSFLRSLARLDPAARARTASAPMLAIQGHADIQVDPEKDGGAIAAALAARNDHSRLVLLQGVNHALQAAADVSFAPRPLAPDVTTSMTQWLLRHLAETSETENR